jgi:hypothetical protein
VTCITVWRRVIGSVGGAWIPFTAAQVAARRAAQMVAVTVCASLPSPAIAPMPAPAPDAWWRAPAELAPAPWAASPHPARRSIPEPGSALVLGVAIAALWAGRSRNKLDAPMRALKETT